MPPFVIKRKLKEAIKNKRNQETKKICETSEFMMGNSWNHLVSNWLENSKTMQTLVSLDSWAVIVGERNPSLHIDHGHLGRWNEFLPSKPFRKSLFIGVAMGMTLSSIYCLYRTVMYCNVLHVMYGINKINPNRRDNKSKIVYVIK